MGAVLEFRRDPNRVLNKARKDIHEEECEWGVVIIFPGIRIERNVDPVDEYLVAEELLNEGEEAASEDSQQTAADTTS